MCGALPHLLNISKATHLLSSDSDNDYDVVDTTQSFSTDSDFHDCTTGIENTDARKSACQKHRQYKHPVEG